MLHDMLEKSRSIFRTLKDKGFFYLLSANFVIGFLGFGSQLLVAKFLTPLEIGQIKTMQSFVGVAAIVAGFGFNTAVLKLCSEKRPLSEKASILKRNMVFSIIPVILVLLILMGLARLNLLSPDNDVNSWMRIYALVIPFMAYTSLLIVYLQALKKIKLMAKTQTAIRLTGFLGLVLATYFIGFSGFVYATVIVAAVALIPLFLLIRNDMQIGQKKEGIFKESFYYARWSVAANMVSTIGSYLDIFLLNYLIDDRVGFGYYGIATIFITGMNYITMTVQNIATPYFSEKSGDRVEFVRVLKKYQKQLIILTLAVTILSIIVVPFIIVMFYGSEYASAGKYFRILAIKYFFWSCYALLGVAILGLGKIKYNFFCASILVIISSFFSYFFIQWRGLTGAAIAQPIVYFIVLVVVIFMTRYAIKNHKFTADTERNTIAQ